MYMIVGAPVVPEGDCLCYTIKHHPRVLRRELAASPSDEDVGLDEDIQPFYNDVEGDRYLPIPYILHLDHSVISTAIPTR